MRWTVVTGVLLANAVAAASALQACTGDNFQTPVDGGVGDAPFDQASEDAPNEASDSGPDVKKSWCQLNAPNATACADFDGVDAASALAPTWFIDLFGNAQLGIATAPVLTSADGAAPSPPNQLFTQAGVNDGGNPPTASLSAAGIANASSATLEFDLLPPTPTGGSSQAVEFARVDVTGQNLSDTVSLSLVREYKNWQVRGAVVGNILPFPTDPIGTNVWHRIRMAINKVGTFEVTVDGVLAVSANLAKAWPSPATGSYGRLEGTEVQSIDTAVKAHFDNVVWQTL